MTSPNPLSGQTDPGRADLFTPIRLLHQAHSGSQPDIWLVQWGEIQCVLRDYSSSRLWTWRLLCRWAVRREIHIHRLLDGIPGIPRLLTVLDRDRYLIEYIDGQPLNNRMHSPGPEFFDCLEGILDAMHTRQVAHGDLRNKNILVGPIQTPYVIDFTTAWWGTALWRVPLLKFYKRLDRRRLALARAKFFPESFTDEDLKGLKQGPVYIRLGRLYRKVIYPVLFSARHREKKSQ